MKAWAIKKGNKYSTSKTSTIAFGKLAETVLYLTKKKAQEFCLTNESVIPIEIKEIK